MKDGGIYSQVQFVNVSVSVSVWMYGVFRVRNICYGVMLGEESGGTVEVASKSM